jgi:RNA polymerase primary sigma factor
MRIESLSPAANGSVLPAGERMLTVDELARQFRVSTKTVGRWRRHGLVSRRFLLAGRKRVGFLQTSVDSFLARNQERVRRGTLFSRMTDEQRHQIVERARHLTQAGKCPVDVTNRIAQEMGRSAETIRYTLKRFNTEHSDAAVFPHRHLPPQPETKRQIFQQYLRGESVAALAQRFHQPQTHIYRIINDLNAARVMELPLDYIGNEQFTGQDSEKKEREILRTLPEDDPQAKKPRVPGGLPAYLAGLYEIPLLSREQEAHLFRKVNYLKHKASALRAQLDPSRPAIRLLRQIEKLYDESVATRAQIVRANLRLVVSIAKRYVGPTQDFFELVSDGNVSLLRAADKFDFSRGNKFSTYATWAIMKNFSRTLYDAARYRDRFSTSHSAELSCAEDVRADQFEQESAQIRRESQVERILGRLDPRERQIVTARFGLTRGREPLTLTQVGAAMGVTKERIRQLQLRAMDKLRAAAKESPIEYTA